MKKINGIIPPMATPLLDNGTLDIEGTERLVNHVIGGGVSALFILGTTGEALSLSPKLRKSFVSLVCGKVAGRVPVLVAITDTSIDESLEMARHGAECGAAGVVAASPCYYIMTQDELTAYFAELADRSPLPLFLYNMPSNVKSFLETGTVRRLSRHPNIAGIKDSSANMAYFQTLLNEFGGREDFAVYMGPEELTAQAVLMGADGGINGGANMFPELYVAMYEAASAGNLERVRELQDRIMEVSTKLYNIGHHGSNFLYGLKCALSLMGICSGYMAWPYRELQGDERGTVRNALLSLGINTI